jgi:hypothetical protein
MGEKAPEEDVDDDKANQETKARDIKIRFSPATTKEKFYSTKADVKLE